MRHSKWQWRDGEHPHAHTHTVVLSNITGLPTMVDRKEEDHGTTTELNASILLTDRSTCPKFYLGDCVPLQRWLDVQRTPPAYRKSSSSRMYCKSPRTAAEVVSLSKTKITWWRPRTRVDGRHKRIRSIHRRVLGSCCSAAQIMLRLTIADSVVGRRSMI